MPLPRERLAYKSNRIFATFTIRAMDSFLHGEIHGRDRSVMIKVAHDMGAASFNPEILIDATLLHLVSGDGALKAIKSTGKKILIEGKADMTVLGLTTIQFTCGGGLITVNDALVVDYLPWPLQISMKHPALSYDTVPSNPGYSRNWIVEVPPFHQDHPYWTSNVHVMGGPYY